MKIGNVMTSTDFFLAPLAAVNCPAFRLQCQSYGAGLTYTQMIDVDTINKEPDFYERFIDRMEGEGPLAVQLIGNRPKDISLAVERVEPYADIIDLNAGCREKDMLARQSGAFLLKHPEQLRRAINAIVSVTNKPVTVKIRSGWDKVNALEIAALIEESGADAVCIHPRLKTEGYTGKADWDVIKKVKDRVNISVIGNGDVDSHVKAEKMKEETNCDAVMVGRAAIGNPSIFQELVQRRKRELNFEDKRRMFIEFSALYRKQGRQRFPELKQHALWFFKGENRSIREKIEKARDEKEIMDSLE